MPSQRTAPIARFARLLKSRAARNVYFWAIALYLAFALNTGNERLYHYGIIRSPWYGPVMSGVFVLQCVLVYGNNLWLIPAFLVKGRRLLYAVLALLLAGLVSMATVAVLKGAAPYLDIAHMQNPAYTMTDISPHWTAGAFLAEFQTFLLSNALWLFAFTMAWYLHDYARQQKALQQSEALRIKAELAFLKNQVNPHFLFNTLNNIYGLALKKEDSAPQAILKLSSLLRYLLYESDTASIPFRQERAAMEAYVEIELLRLPEDATLRLDIFADRDYSIPALLWMAQLENAFKHGTRLIGIPVSVDFRFRIEADVLRIMTVNNCMPGEAGDGGIGLANLRKRLDILYPGRYSLECSRKEHSFTSSLNVQLT